MISSDFLLRRALVVISYGRNFIHNTHPSSFPDGEVVTVQTLTIIYDSLNILNLTSQIRAIHRNTDVRDSLY